MWTKTIQSVADQLYYLIKDYDVSYMVAELYVQKRVQQTTEESRRYQFDRLTLRLMPDEMKEKNNKLSLLIKDVNSATKAINICKEILKKETELVIISGIFLI